MAEIIEIPLNADNTWFTQRLILDDNEYLMEFTWNTRGEKWIVSLYNAIGISIITGIPLNVSVDLFNKFKDSELPDGMIFLYDNEGAFDECTREGLGDRWKLYYGTDDE